MLHMDAFVSVLPIVGTGMLGIFVVTGLIVATVTLLRKILG